MYARGSALCCAFALAASSAALASWRAPDEEAVRASMIRAQASGSLATRLVAVSDRFVGAPYAISPLGEGAGVDPDPRMRFDAFDCTTFVETALALALAQDLEEAQALLDLIRYRQAHPDILARRHFPAAEWIPELIELGFLEEMTRQIAGSETVVEKKRLDLATWERRKRPSHLELPPERIPDGVFALDVWPLDLARAGQARIPPGTVLNVVRVDFKSVPVRVSHQGLVIRKDGQLFLRHAADRMYHSVVDEPLDHFFARMQKYKRWPVRGVHLARVSEPPDWRQKLAASTIAPPSTDDVTPP